MKALIFLLLILVVQECTDNTAEKTNPTGIVYNFDNPAPLGSIRIFTAKPDTIYGRVIGGVNEVLVGDSLTYEMVYDNTTVSKFLAVGKHTGFITIINPVGLNRLQPATYPFKVKVSNNNESFYGLMKIAKYQQ